MGAAHVFERGITNGCNACSHGRGSDVERAAHTVQDINDVRRRVGPAEANAAQCVNLGKGPRHDGVVTGINQRDAIANLDDDNQDGFIDVCDTPDVLAAVVDLPGAAVASVNEDGIARGVLVVDPASGRLTGADTGPGRLPEPEELFAIASSVLRRGTAATDLAGRRVVISAGGTREAIDPVRFLGNRSTGRQGYALARAALARGASVTLVAANVALPDPHGATVVPA